MTKLTAKQLAQVLSQDGYSAASSPVTKRQQPAKSVDKMKQDGITLTLPYPPSANRYWRVFRNRVVVSGEATRYKKDAAAAASMQGIDEPLTGDLSLAIKVYRPLKSGDLDNRLKVVLDSLQGIAYKNDSQIVEIRATRFDDKSNPRIEISISEIQR
jgi:Holliday junction resolvase RusA-like endonuclease